MNKFTAFLNDESGATAIEYGLIAAGISVAIIGAVNALGTQLGTSFNQVTTAMGTAGDGIDGVAAASSTTTSAN